MSEVENPGAGEGMVVLDIGDDIGALVISTPPDMVDLELEICPSGRRADPPPQQDGHDGHDGHHGNHGHDGHQGNHGHDGHHGNHGHERRWPHVAVLARHTPAGTAHAAVFPGLRAGLYDVWVKPDGPILLQAEVRGGQVTELSCDATRDGSR